jgi:hypothetical protein
MGFESGFGAGNGEMGTDVENRYVWWARKPNDTSPPHHTTHGHEPVHDEEVLESDEEDRAHTHSHHHTQQHQQQHQHPHPHPHPHQHPHTHQYPPTNIDTRQTPHITNVPLPTLTDATHASIEQLSALVHEKTVDERAECAARDRSAASTPTAVSKPTGCDGRTCSGAAAERRSSSSTDEDEGERSCTPKREQHRPEREFTATGTEMRSEGDAHAHIQAQQSLQ